MEIDLAIIGGGPAGTAAALEARRRGMKVAVWEREHFPRHKVCGEFISAESIPLLRKEIPQTVARGAQVRHSEFISLSGQVSGFHLPRAGCGLSRRVLDESLWRAAEAAGARMHESDGVARLAKLEKDGEGWEIHSTSGVSARARFLIIACGRWWSIEGFPSPAREHRESAEGPWMGVKAHFAGIVPRDVVEMYYFTGGYCGVAPIEDGLSNVCCLVHRKFAAYRGKTRFNKFAAWLESVARHPALDARLRGGSQCSETITTAPVRAARRRATFNGALLVGDASGFLDPFTGDGISMALHSGRLAASAIFRTLSENGSRESRAARVYAQGLGKAVRGSYMVAGILRGLVAAPAGVQSAAAAALPWLGQRLLAGTRWRVT